jgi:hypothetical protein
LLWEITIMSATPDSTERDPRTDSSPAAETPDPTPKTPPAASLPSGPGALLVSALGAALVAGLLAWGLGERMNEYYRPSKEANRGRFDFSALNREQAIADQKNAVIAFGTFGALLAALVGTAGGLGRRGVMATSRSTLVGFFGGGIGAGLAAYVLAPLFVRFYSDYDPVLLLPVIVRGGICAVVGMVAGLAFGLATGGRGDARRSLTGGLLGSILGIIVFESLNAVYFAMDRNDKAIPSTIFARLLCYMCVAVGVAAGAVIIGRGKQEDGKGTLVAP